ncbi:MAG: SCO family protein [Flavobacteriales bacterium]|nr:SCO family protein [Flavobacteriales bacterium]
MSTTGRPDLKVRIALLAVLFLGATVVGYFIIRPQRQLPVFHPSQLDPRLVDPAVRGERGEHRILDFRLIDQLGDTLTRDAAKGKVIVADFFFTTCATICPRMTVQMARVQQNFLKDDRVLLLSHSVTPEIDDVTRLAEYAELKGVDHRRWRLLTGPRREIYKLARRSYFAALDEGDGGPDDFVHTENFVLVDEQGRIRGFYDGTSAKEVDQLIKDLRLLLDEGPSSR